MTEVSLAQWIWNTDDPLRPYWVAPSIGSVGCIDLRSSVQSGTPGPVQQGWGIFAYPTAQVISGALALGADLNRALTNPQKNAFRTRLGLPSALSASTLVDALWEILTTQADATGLLRCKPLMPTIQGNLELHLGGFSRIKSKPFSFSDPEGPVVQAALQEQYRQMRQEYPADVYKRVLGAWRRKYRVSDYRIFLPPGVPDEGVLEPHTTITDDFNRADNPDNLGANWTTDTGELNIVTNEVNAITGSAANLGRYSATALSTDDHYAQVTIVGNLAEFQGPVARKVNSGTLTWYEAVFETSGADSMRIRAVIAGTPTELSSVAIAGADSDVVRIEVNGSTLKQFQNGAQRGTDLTDTNITGNLMAGIVGYHSNVDLDNFEAADLPFIPPFGVVLGEVTERCLSVSPTLFRY